MSKSKLNPNRRMVKRDCFNNARTTRRFSENATNITDEQNQEQKLKQAKMIERVQKELNED